MGNYKFFFSFFMSKSYNINIFTYILQYNYICNYIHKNICMQTLINTWIEDFKNSSNNNKNKFE